MTWPRDDHLLQLPTDWTAEQALAVYDTNTVVAVVTRNDAGERSSGKEVHQLGEQGLAGIHDQSSEGYASEADMKAR